MKLVALSLFVSAAAVFAAPALANDIAAPDVEILSVIPRSPDVKPYLLSLPAEGRTQHDVKPVKASPPPAQPKPEQTAMDQGK